MRRFMRSFETASATRAVRRAMRELRRASASECAACGRGLHGDGVVVNGRVVHRTCATYASRRQPLGDRRAGG
jgi:hypothetical protein